MTHAGAVFWDRFFRELRESGQDLDWAGRWTGPCEGYSVTAIDLSAEAIRQARARFGSSVRFLIADMSVPLPFPEGSFDAVMSNVALHMFPDSVTRAVFAEVGRVVRPDGLFLFHVNAIGDRPLRARWRPVARELEKDYVLEQSGQTMHFFSAAYLRELLRDWGELRLDLVTIAHRETGEPFKQVWRGRAQR